GGFQIFMNLLVQDRASKRGARGRRIPRILSDKLTIRTNRPLRIAFFLRLLSDLKKLRRIPAQFLFTGRDIFCFFTGPKNNRTISRLNQEQALRQQQKQWENAEFHWDWQGN